MTSINRPKFGQARDLVNRVNINLLKPVNLDHKNRLLYSQRINDENQDIVDPVQGKNGLKVDVPVKKNQLVKTASGSRIPVFGTSRDTNKPVVPQPKKGPKQETSNKANAIQPIHPVINRSLKIENIDTDRNIFLLGEYAEDVYNYLFQLEKKYQLKPRFMRDLNPTFTESTRAVLVNWICSVHSRYACCNNETLYLTVAIIDHFLAAKPISKDRLQLMGVTAFFVASKFEEIYYPDVKEIVSFCDNLYTKRDVLKMELEILKVLDFGLGMPLVIHFLRRGSKAARSSSTMHMMSKYLCELSLLDYEISSWPSSLIAAVALFVTLRMFETNQISSEEEKKNIDKIWNATIEHYTGHSQTAVLKYSPYMCRAIVKAESSKFQNVRKKYSESRYLKISSSPMLSLPFIRQFASKIDSPRNIALPKK